jgi:WD40 repeat protein
MLGNASLPDGGRRNLLRLREATTGKERVTLTFANGESTSCMIFAPDGRTLALGLENGAIMLWDVVQDKEIATLKGHTEAVRALAFSPDGKLQASGSTDKTVKLWGLTNSK